jgi:hypothetical protein
MAIARPGDGSARRKAIRWEKETHGKRRPGVEAWWGHCPGWTASATLTAPITRATWFRPDGAGGVARCADGEAGCTKFEIGDLNALQAEIHEGAPKKMIGAACGLVAGEIPRDADGRVIRDGARGCQGLNAGSLLIVAGNLLRLRETPQPFGVFAQNETNTAEIWNQPAFRYTVFGVTPLDEAQAANLVAHGKLTGDRTDYVWNDAAAGWAHVLFSISWVSETPGPNVAAVSGLETSKRTIVSAVIELDRPARDPEARIVGGEYTEDPLFGASRLRNHPRAWLASGPGPEPAHNPHVSNALVERMVALALEPR